MWRNYLTVGLRALMKNKTYAFINIFGLAIGMAACLMILLYVRYEISYDRWIPDAERVYQVQSWYKSSETGAGSPAADDALSSPGKSLRERFPADRAGGLRHRQRRRSSSRTARRRSTEDYLWVDGNFLDVMPLPLVRGDRDALGQVNIGGAHPIARRRRRFGTDDVVGQTLTLISRGKTTRLPDHRHPARTCRSNSHLRIDSLIRHRLRRLSMPTMPQVPRMLGLPERLGLCEAARRAPTPRRSSAGLPAWEKRNIPDENAGEARFNAGDDQDWHIVNVRRRPSRPAPRPRRWRPATTARTIVTFAIVALLILGMAVVNFTNLATARASQRAREVALRKVLGASRRQLIVQFIGESIIVAVVAMLIALALVELPLPPLRRLPRCRSAASPISAPSGIAAAGARCWCWSSASLGGLYPAFFLSRFQPATVLKANKSSAETPGTGRLRNVLVVAQFAVSIGLIICTAVIYAPDRLRADRRSRLQPRATSSRSTSSRRYQLIDQGETIAERMRRVPGVAGGRAHHDRRRHRQQQQYRRDGPRQSGAGQHRQLHGRRGLLRRDGHAAGRRALVRRSAGRWTT